MADNLFLVSNNKRRVILTRKAFHPAFKLKRLAEKTTMKKLALFTIILGLLACQNQQFTDHTNQLKPNRNIDPKTSTDPIGQKLWYKKNTDEIKPYRFMRHLEGNLIVHSKFLYLEDLDMKTEDIQSLRSLKYKYTTESVLLTPYRITDESLYNRYKHLIGEEIIMNNYNRDQYTASVKDIVIIEDRMVRKPYVAAVLSAPKGKNIYYAWVSMKSSIAYPFESSQSDKIEQVQKRFENSSAYAYFEEKYETQEKDYSEVTIRSFEHFEGQQYFVAQYNVFGNCSSLIDNLVAVYKLEQGKIKLMAINTSDYYFIDLIDINGDDFPELLSGDFSSSVVYSIDNGEIEEVKNLTWSTEVCPC